MAGEDINKFRKGHLNSKNPYQDPTFLTFQLMFDSKSPLFNLEVAAKSLEHQYNDKVRADKLKLFVETLLMLNKEMPWYFKSVSGVEKVFNIDELNPYWGGDDAVLEIECNESINLAITGLMDLYKTAVFDTDAWMSVLPENYKKFNLIITVSEVRTIMTKLPNRKTNTETEINTDITIDNEPKFQIEFMNCEFKMDSAMETFESLTNTAPEQPAPKIRIEYQNARVKTASYLQGISDLAIDNSINTSGEVRDTDGFIRSAGDRLSRSLQDAAQNLTGDIKGMDPRNSGFMDRPGNVYGSTLDRAFERFVSNTEDTLFGISNIPENLFRDGTSTLTTEGNTVINNINRNIFGATNATTIGEALKQGAINSILPSINNVIDSRRKNLGNTFK